MGDSAPKKKAPNKMLFIIIALVLGAGGAFVFTRNASTGSREKGKKHGAESKPGPKVDLGEFMVNLSGGPDHYLKANITIELEAGTSEEKSKEELPVIKDAVVTTLTHKRIDELQSSKGMEKLKKEIKARINKALGEEELVTRVYFTAFVTQ